MIAYIGIGANLGDAQLTVLDAMARLDTLPETRLVARSALYRTAPIDSSGDDYVNAVVCVVTPFSPHELLAALQRIELAHGRERPYRNAPRTLDLDLLLYGSQVINDKDLQVPHPRMLERAFVLVPLLEIASHIDVPGHGPARNYLSRVVGQDIDKL